MQTSKHGKLNFAFLYINMNIEYHNAINQLPLVNNWCIATKLHKYYVKHDPELIDNINIANLYITYGFIDWDKGMENAALNNHFDLVKFFIEKGANDWNEGMENAALQPLRSR
jgi:hypothetical protein